MSEEEKEKKYAPILVNMESRRTLSPGDFNADLSADKRTLFVPAALAEKIGLRSGFRTVEVLLSYVHAFPSSFMQGLGWTLEQVREATAKLVAQLEGLVAERCLRPGPPRKFAMGALPPPGHRVQKGYVVGEDDKDPERGSGN